MNSSPVSESYDAHLSVVTEGLGKRFNREWIFRNLSYRFLPGVTYAITGPNGSGKSTLLQVLWGQMPQTSGILRYESTHKVLAIDESYQYISIATPYMDLIEEFTLAEMVNFHFRLKKIRKGFTMHDVIARMYLTDSTHKQLINFSSGMKQRLKLALAFYTDAHLYFLDEPGTNLDKRAFDWYKHEFAHLPKNATVFVASNNAAEYPENATVLNIMDLKR